MGHLPTHCVQEEEDGGMEDPPEINDFIRELGGSLAQEAGAAPGGGLSIPRCGSEGVGGQELRQQPLPMF